MPEKLSVAYWSLEDIKPYDSNPRNNELAVASVKKSIESFGFLVPIVVDALGVIVAGHTRYMAATDLNLDEVPVVKASHLSEAQIMAFRIADNRVAENATWDTNLLEAELRAIESMGFDLSSTGFSKDELDCLLTPISADCLDDLDTDSVCGFVEPVAIPPKETATVRVGDYSFNTYLSDYQEWEAAMLQEHVSESAIEQYLSELLGLPKYKIGVIKESQNG